jgi:carbonic anhydrase/acetyltransferase-like protein (isoleucine patch superfamily)
LSRGGAIVAEPHERVFAGVAPTISPGAYVAPGAVLIGDVTVGDESSIWYNVVLRADQELIVVGRCTNVQDNCVVHGDPGQPAVIGDHVTIGHSAVIHGATVEDDVLIGINATILNGAVVGRGSIVGAGAVVTEGTTIPPGSLVLGVPGRVVRSLKPEEVEEIHQHAVEYCELARQHKRSPL